VDSPLPPPTYYKSDVLVVPLAILPPPSIVPSGPYLLPVLVSDYMIAPLML